MLNNNFKLFDVVLPSKKVENVALVMTGCNAYIRDMKDKESMVYSEFEELSFSCLNSNDYENYNMEIEFCFENNLHEPYHWFYAGCFSIRTDTGLKIKLNGNPNGRYLAKINKNNQMVLGIGVFFKSDEEYQKMCNSTIILIEGFIALDNYNNTFEVSCKLRKQNDIWDIIFANTYQMDKKDDIRNKVH